MEKSPVIEEYLKPIIWKKGLIWFCSLAREPTDPDSYYYLANGQTPAEAYQDWIRIITRDYI